MIIIGSHNTMSYLPASGWWRKPFAVWARCQDKTIKEQMGSGVRYFDLRVRFDKEGLPYFCHGAMRYESDKNVLDIAREIAEYSEEISDRVYVRVLLETTTLMGTKERTRQETLFKKLEKSMRQEDKEWPSLMVLSFGIKYPWKWNDSGKINFPDGFCEISKQHDVKWHAAIPPKGWLWEQRRIEKVVEGLGYEGILAKDFV